MAAQPNRRGRDAAYWRKAYEDLVDQTGRDLNDGLGRDPRREGRYATSGRAAPVPATPEGLLPLERFADALKVMRKRAIELTEKYGDPNGTDYEQGVNDHGHRWVSQIDDLIALAALQPQAQGGE